MIHLPEEIRADLQSYLAKNEIRLDVIRYPHSGFIFEGFYVDKSINDGLYHILYEERGRVDIIYRTNNVVEVLIKFIGLLEDYKIIKAAKRLSDEIIGK